MRKFTDLQAERQDMPVRSTLIVWSEFVELANTTPERLRELMDMGWLEPTRTAEEALLFRPIDVYRMRKLERLCADFELHTLGGTIVVDLLERVEELERRMRTFSGER